MGAKKACPPSTTPTSTKPATPAPTLLDFLLLHVLWQNETESEPLVAVEVYISPNQPAVGCVECVECETLFGSSSNYLSYYCSTVLSNKSLVLKMDFRPGCRRASKHISRTACRIATKLVGVPHYMYAMMCWELQGCGVFF